MRRSEYIKSSTHNPSLLIQRGVFTFFSRARTHICGKRYPLARRHQKLSSLHIPIPPAQKHAEHRESGFSIVTSFWNRTVAEDRAQYVRHRKQDTHGDGAQK
jgi:hypothetical protein